MDNPEYADTTSSVAPEGPRWLDKSAEVPVNAYDDEMPPQQISVDYQEADPSSRGSEEISGDADIKQTSDDGRVRMIRLTRTLCMPLFYVAMGLYAGQKSPSMIDLKELFHCNIQELGATLTGAPGGLMAGSLLGGWLVMKFRRHSDLWLFFTSTFSGVLNSAIPWAPNLPLAAVLMVAQGILLGTQNVMCNTLMMAEWGEASPMPLNAIHMAFNLGVFLAPPTTLPFLATNNSVNYTLHNGKSNAIMDWVLPTQYQYLSNSMPSNTSTSQTRVYIPFAMYGGIGVLGGLIFLGFYISGWEYQSVKETSESAEESTSSNDRIDRWFTAVMAFSMFMAYLAIVTRDNSLGSYLFYIAMNSSIHIKSKQRAALLNTAYNATWLISRILGIIMTKYIKIHYMVFGGVFAVLVNTIFLIFFGLKSELSFWILSCSIGLLSGPCYPCVLSWADRYIPMRGLLVSVLDIGIGSGALLSVYLGGFILHHFNPVYIFVLCAAGSVLLVLVLVPLQIYCSMKGDRFKRELIAVDYEATLAEPEHDLLISSTEPLINS